MGVRVRLMMWNGGYIEEVEDGGNRMKDGADSERRKDGLGRQEDGRRRGKGRGGREIVAN